MRVTLVPVASCHCIDPNDAATLQAAQIFEEVSLVDIDLILPYRTDWREMHRVLDYCKGKGADRTVLDARFGGGESLRETLNALEQLGLIDRNEAGDVRLTARGDQLAYAPNDSDRRQLLVEALLRYLPYRIPLERASDEERSVLDAPTVERIWQVDMRLGQPRNRVEEARTFFFRLADDAGLGTYRRGVRGQTTRLELAPDFREQIYNGLADLEGVRPDAAPEAEQPEEDVSPPVESTELSEDAPVSDIAPGNHGNRPETSLSIQVDMSDWDLDKIEAFLRMIGYLEEP